MSATKIEVLCQKAQLAIAQRAWDKAKQYYLQALGLKSDVPDIHYGLATVYFQLREMTSAAHHFREVTRLDPLRPGAHVNLGAVLNSLGQLDEALTALRRGLQLDPKRIEGYYNAGLVYRRKGQLDLAIQAYREALRLNPRMADAHLNLGNIYLEKQQYRQAVSHYESAVKLRPGWDKADDGLAEATARLEEGKQQASGSSVAAPVSVKSVLETQVDPTRHHKYLTLLNKLAADSEEKGEALEQLLIGEVEPSIKDLSSCLLHANGSRQELEERLDRFEEAIQRLRDLQQVVQTTVTRVQDCGAQLPVNG